MAEPLIVYEKKTCITCKKALAFLDESGITYQARDIVKDPPSAKLLEAALDEKDIKASLNPRSTIYKEKNLGKVALKKPEIIKLMLEDPNLIKRPFIVKPGSTKAYQGFDPDALKRYLKS